MDVQPVRIERHVIGRNLLVVDGDERQIDVGPGPDLVVRQAATEDRSQDGTVLLHLLDKCVERLREPLLDWLLLHAPPPSLNHLARFREGEPPGEPSNPARTEPRPPGITKGHLVATAIRAILTVSRAPVHSIKIVVPTRGNLRSWRDHVSASNATIPT